MFRATVCLKGELKDSISGYHSKHDGYRIFSNSRRFYRRMLVNLLRMETDYLRPIVSLLKVNDECRLQKQIKIL